MDFSFYDEMQFEIADYFIDELYEQSYECGITVFLELLDLFKRNEKERLDEFYLSFIEILKKEYPELRKYFQDCLVLNEKQYLILDYDEKLNEIANKYGGRPLKKSVQNKLTKFIKGL